MVVVYFMMKKSLFAPLVSSVFALSIQTYAQQVPSFEQPPVFEASKILPPELLSGPMHRVREAAPSDGFLIHFTMNTDFGTIQCRGVNQLKVRVHEMQAIKLLIETSKGDLFAEGLKRSVEAPIDAVKNIAEDPEKALRKAPSTIGHMFQKVGSSVSNAADKTADKWNNRDKNGDASEQAVAAGKGVGNAAKSVAGFDKAKLDCARKLGVNPYSDNKLLQREMEEVTWAFFAGGLPLRLGASAVSGGASMTLTATKAVGIPEDLYDVTPGELLLRDRQAMEAMGASQDLIEKVLRNPHLTVALRNGIVNALVALPNSGDKLSVLGVAADFYDIEQARYFYQVLDRLKQRHATKPYAAITNVNRMPAGVTQDKVVDIVAPVDYISWTEQIANFARTPKMPGMKYRAIIQGQISPAAKGGFESAGWEVVVEN